MPNQTIFKQSFEPYVKATILVPDEFQEMLLNFLMTNLINVKIKWITLEKSFRVWDYTLSDNPK